MVHDRESLARFLYSRNHFAVMKGTVKHAAFMPARDLRTSVFRKDDLMTRICESWPTRVRGGPRSRATPSCWLPRCDRPDHWMSSRRRASMSSTPTSSAGRRNERSKSSWLV